MPCSELWGLAVRRRDFVKGIAGSAIGWPVVARAQSRPLIGYISSRSARSDAPFVAAFRAGLGEIGGEAGSAKIEFRWADNQPSRLEALASDLVQLKPSVIFAGGGAGTVLSVKKLTRSIPIVFATGTDPVKAGLVHSIGRPEANVTGVSFLATEIVGKRLELLLSFVPNAKSIAILVNPKNPESASMSHDVEAAERSLKIPLQTYNVSTEGEMDDAFSKLEEKHPDALLIGGDTFFNAQRQKLAAFCLRQALPAIFDTREFAADGGLMSYGTSQTSAYRQAGEYVGHIIGGAKPSELPVVQSTHFELVINRATAKALKLQIPDRLTALADEVIE
jgi:putative ABC transport system substrate-binding protein